MSGTYDRSVRKGQLNPAVSYNFGLEVEAMFFVPLRSVRVFTKENEFDYYQEGGLNDYVHMLRKPISKPFTFQVEKYVGTDNGIFDQNSGPVDPLALGTELVLPLILYVNRAQTANAGENFDFNNCARAYIFTACTVISKEYGELNAEQSKLLVETTTIAYKELFAINQFNPSAERGDPWAFDKQKGYLGTDNHFAARPKTLKASYINAAKSDMEYKGNNEKWDFKKDLKPGTVGLAQGDFYKGNSKFHTKDSSRKNDSKKDGESRGKSGKWEIDKDVFDGNKKYHTDERARKNDPKSKGESTGKGGMWEISKDTFDGNKQFHTDERARKNDPKAKRQTIGNDGKWDFKKDLQPGTVGLAQSDFYRGNSKFHTDERSRKNDPKSKGESTGKGGMWEIDKDTFDGNKKYHTDERGRKNDPKSKGESTGKSGMWEIEKDTFDGNKKYHTDERGRKNDSKSAGESKGKSNEWIYDGTVDGSGASHTKNRNKNTKPTPVIWPPQRRARMAKELTNA